MPTKNLRSETNGTFQNAFDGDGIVSPVGRIQKCSCGRMRPGQSTGSHQGDALEPTELYIQESSGENGSLNSHDLEYDDHTIGMARSSPLFTQEREDSTSRRRAYHSHAECLSSSQPSSVGHGTRRPVVEQFNSQILNVREIRAAAQKMSKSGFFRSDKESRFSQIVKQRFKNTSSTPIMTEELFKSRMK